MLKVFCVFDSKAEAYLQPFFSTNRATAIRSFAQAAADPQTAFSQNGADYTLFEMGEWDPFKGTLVCYDAKVSLGTALEFASLMEK